MSLDEARAAIAWQKSLFLGAAAIFTFSDYIRRSFLTDYALDPERVITVGSGPNLPLDRIPRTRLHREGSKAPTILFVGRDFEHKGGPVMLEAFRLVRERLPDARLLIVGPSSLSLAEPGVESLGFLRKDAPADFERLMQAYAAADVFCLPTRYESFGIAFVEAMWFGLPVVAPAQWAIPEIVEHGTTGFLVDREAATTYASRLLELLEEPSRAREMGGRGRERAESRFSWDHVAVRMTEIISVQSSSR
jgi:glycosyltransferase involved in cell wall biosynthesis